MVTHSSMMKATCILLLCLWCTRLFASTQADGKTPRCSEAMEGEIRLETVSRNVTCSFDVGVVFICTLESPGSTEYLWKTICDEEWTDRDAQVACRQLDYSAIGARAVSSYLSISPYTSIVPECKGGEPNITSCALRNTSLQLHSCGFIPGVKCFLNDFAVSICFDTSMPPITTTAISGTTQQVVSSIENPTTPKPTLTERTTVGGQSTTNFLTSSIGIGIIATITNIAVTSVGVIVVIVIGLLIWRRVSAKHLRTTTQNHMQLEDFSKQSSNRPITKTNSNFEEIDSERIEVDTGNELMVDNSAYTTRTRMMFQGNSAYVDVQAQAAAEPLYEDVSHLTH